LTVNFVIAVACFAPILRRAIARFHLQQMRQEMVSTTVLSLPTMTDLELFHKSSRAATADFSEPR
jgi:hypothetical protein